jgi:hypothetical protein
MSQYSSAPSQLFLGEENSKTSRIPEGLERWACKRPFGVSLTEGIDIQSEHTRAGRGGGFLFAFGPAESKLLSRAGPGFWSLTKVGE